MTPMWRLATDSGEAVDQSEDGIYQLVEPDPNEYQTPPDDMKARYELSGISEEFEMESQFSDTPARKFRVEFKVVKPAQQGNAGLTGKRFTQLVNVSTHPKSTLGKLLGRLRGQEIGLGETVDVDSFIGTTFVARCTTEPQGRYATIEPQAIERETIKLPLASANGKAPVSKTTAPPASESDDEGLWDEDPDALT
jgi:hypothetical protein